MGIRQSINEHPKAAMATCGIAIVAIVGFLILWNSSLFGGEAAVNPSAKSWYTDDDGRTFFADDADRISPFDHNGKKAYRCSVWSCDGGKTKFVSDLERLKDAAWNARKDKGRMTPHDLVLPMDMQVKRPQTGDVGWTDFDSSAGEAIRTPHPPPGQQGVPQSVEAR